MTGIVPHSRRRGRVRGPAPSPRPGSESEARLPRVSGVGRVGRVGRVGIGVVIPTRAALFVAQQVPGAGPWSAPILVRTPIRCRACNERAEPGASDPQQAASERSCWVMGNVVQSTEPGAAPRHARDMEQAGIAATGGWQAGRRFRPRPSGCGPRTGRRQRPPPPCVSQIRARRLLRRGPSRLRGSVPHIHAQGETGSGPAR
jgi:hypothetical protein